MNKWRPNEEVLEDMLKKLEAMPNQLGCYHIAGVPGGVGSILYTIGNLASGTECGRNIYETFLEHNYLTYKKKHSK